MSQRLKTCFVLPKTYRKSFYLLLIGSTVVVCEVDRSCKNSDCAIKTLTRSYPHVASECELNLKWEPCDIYIYVCAVSVLVILAVTPALQIRVKG